MKVVPPQSESRTESRSRTKVGERSWALCSVRTAGTVREEMPDLVVLSGSSSSAESFGRLWWLRWRLRSGRCGSWRLLGRTPAAPSGNWRRCAGSGNEPGNESHQWPKNPDRCSLGDGEILTIFSKTTDRAAVAVKKAATTIMITPTALFEPIAAMALIQPL